LKHEIESESSEAEKSKPGTERSIQVSIQGEMTPPLTRFSLSKPKNSTKREPNLVSRNVVHDRLEFSQIYVEGQEIGQGGHAVVKRCFKRSQGDDFEYAVKIFRSGEPEIINTIKKTFQNNIKLKHPNVCKAFELFIDERSEQCYFVSEYSSWPSLE